MLSILIPSRNEPFLLKTVSDLLTKAEGEVQVIIVLDGYWEPPVDDPRVVYIHRGEALGMRAGINAAAALAKGEFLMKLDAHCMVSQGFDKILTAECERNSVVIPRRKRLDAENWSVKDVGKPDIDYMYLAPADDPTDFGGKGLNGKNWNEKNADESLRSILIDDVMSAQGSCWLMRKEYFYELELMDEEHYGTFWNEAQEIMLKAWLSGGRCVVNKKAWYAHLHKGKKHGRGYRLNNRELDKGAAYTRKWMNFKEAWPKQTLPIEWLVEKFNPPGWSTILPSPPPRMDIDRTAEELREMHMPKFKRGDLAKRFAEMGFTKGAEIGVADGRFSEYMCKVIPGLQLMCVDPWEPYPENGRYLGYSRRDGNRPNEELARERMAPYGAKMIKAMSMDAVRDVPKESLDFVYIDAHHDFDFVMQDIIEWAKRVKKGGIVAGHDYYDFKSSGVKEAVQAYLVGHRIDKVCLTDEREPSWFFTKS